MEPLQYLSKYSRHTPLKISQKFCRYMRAFLLHFSPYEGPFFYFFLIMWALSLCKGLFSPYRGSFLGLPLHTKISVGAYAYRRRHESADLLFRANTTAACRLSHRTGSWKHVQIITAKCQRQ